MSKCPECDSDMVWEGSMLDGGLVCPLRLAHPATKPERLSPEMRNKLLDGPAAKWKADPFDFQIQYEVRPDMFLIRCRCGRNFHVHVYDLANEYTCTCGARSRIAARALS